MPLFSRGKALICMVSFLCCCQLQYSACLPLEGTDADSANPDLCSICLDAVKLVQIALDSNATFEDVLPLAEKLCDRALGKVFNYVGTYMCPGLLQSYGPVVQYVLTRLDIEPVEICEALHACVDSTSSEDRPHLHLFQHVVGRHLETLRKKDVKEPPDEFPHKTSSQQLLKALEEVPKLWNGAIKSSYRKADTRRSDLTPSKSTITFLQLSDIHLDKYYAEGSPTHCHLYTCCRSWYNGTGQAGRYGAYECDLPMTTLKLLVDHLRKLDPQPDFIIYTGDNPPHDIWNETFASQLEVTQFLVDYLAQQLPNINIYPAIGNHETWPESEYLAELWEYQVITRTLANYWMDWADLPPEAFTTITKGAYYSTKIADKLKLISFNSDYGYILNFYSFLNEQNPYYYDQMNWMMEQLTQAEQAGEKVLVIAHIPPGDTECHAAYGQFYLNMTRRFSDTIVGHLFGHTHNDQIQLIQDANGVYGVALIAPSVTPYGHMNPSFRLFTMDADTYQLLEYQQYHLNLTKANELASRNITPEFELIYNTSEEYGLKDLSPEAYADLVERFDEFDSLLEQYRYNLVGRSLPLDKNCDSLCRQETRCQVRNIISTEYLKCVGRL